jgi:hypothetical protein
MYILMKNTRKKLKNIRSKTKRNIKKRGGLPPTAAPPTAVTPPVPSTAGPSTAAAVTPPAPPTAVPPTAAPPTELEVTPPVTSTPPLLEDAPKLLSDIETKINALPDSNTNKAVFTKILLQLKQVELNDTIIETLRTFLSKIDSIKIIDPNKINEINTKLTVIDEEIKENNEINTNNEKNAVEEGEEPALSGKLAHLTFPIELLDAVKNCINHARNYDFVEVGPTGEELS